MASLALSVAGSAIGGPIGGMIGGAVGGLIDNLIFPVKAPAPPKITSSTYGEAIPLPYGPKTRLGCKLIWTSGWYKSTGKNAKLAQLKGLPPQFQADLALLVAAGPLDPSWCRKIIANGNVLFDAAKAMSDPTPDANGVVTWTHDGKTHKDFETLVVYPGNATQLPNPTIEAHLGVGNTEAYRGSAYMVMTGLKGTPFGNAVPLMNAITRAHVSITLAEVCCDIARRSGLDLNTISTSGLTDTIGGYAIESQSDGVSALQPLALCYDFDVAEVAGALRLAPRGRPPICAVTNDQLAGHERGAQRPSFKWPRDAESSLPRLAALTFVDPDRDCQENTQSAKRDTGSAQSNLSAKVPLTLTSDQARKIADRLLWEAHYARQKFEAATNDRLGFLESAGTYAVETPFGFETVRLGRRARGANSVIEFDAKRDASSLYVSSAPGASAASFDNKLGIGGPVNPPYFIQPPSSGFPSVSGRFLFIAISGGDGTLANDAWGGCNVYVATDDVTGDYNLVGVQIGPACMGKLTANLASYGGSLPDTAHTLSIDTSMSNGEPNALSPSDAADGLTPYWVNGEYMTAELVAALGADLFNLTRLWRHYYGSAAVSHSIGDPIARIDSGVFRWALPDVYASGRTLYFRFVSAGETLASATTYPYTLTA